MIWSEFVSFMQRTDVIMGAEASFRRCLSVLGVILCVCVYDETTGVSVCVV